MCNLYRIRASRDEVAHHFRARATSDFAWKEEIYPRYAAPVVIQAEGERRCLVPFTQFAEPKSGKDKHGRPAQYWFTVTDQPIAAFAGLWRPTEAGPVFAFCTTEPNALIAPLHPKAMPVVLGEAEQDVWLTGSADEALGLVASYPSQLMAVG